MNCQITKKHLKIKTYENKKDTSQCLFFYADNTLFV